MKTVLLPALLLLADPALGQPIADLAAIDSAVARFTGVAQGAPGGAALPVDRRLRLAPCSVPLTLEWYGQRRDTIVVNCLAPGGWHMFVPLVAGGSAIVAAPVVLRGDAVTITVRGEGFAVAQAGEALESGTVGSWIKVRGTTTNAAIQRARVEKPGAVGMELP